MTPIKTINNADESPYRKIDDAMESLREAVALAMRQGGFHIARRCISALIAVDPARGHGVMR